MTANLKEAAGKTKKKGMPKIIKRMILIFCILLVLAASAFAAIQIYINKSAEDYMVTLDTAPEAEAVIILGAMVYSNGSPSPILRDRLDYGYELYINGNVKKILVSGDHGTMGYDEVNAMRDYLLERGVPREDIFMDHAGFNTYDSMYRAREIFGIDTLIISTQEFHISRAVYIARSLGLDAYGYPSEDKDIYNMFYLNARESLAKVKAFLDTDILRREPKFLGETIPIMGDGTVTEG